MSKSSRARKQARRRDRHEADLTGKIIQAGIDNPLSDSDAEKLLAKIIKRIQVGAIISHDHETLSNLDGDPAEIAKSIVKRGR